MSDTLVLGKTTVPPRLERLPWSSFHVRVVFALGVAWALDGLQVTLFASLTGAIHDNPDSGLLKLSESQIGSAASAYLFGAVIGALGFGWLADRFGRKPLFFATLILYMLASIATGFAQDFWSFALFRALTGAGVGGECAAINSAIQELVPAHRRGRVDLCVNGTFWVGAVIGALMSLAVLYWEVIRLEWKIVQFAMPLLGLNPETTTAQEIGWRAAFIASGVLSLIVLVWRRDVPESPRWLMRRGRLEEADNILTETERKVEARYGPLEPLGEPVDLPRYHRTGLRDLWVVMSGKYFDRAVLGLALISCQAFFYNAIFFTYALVLMRFCKVPAPSVGLYILPLALGNLLGPLLLGRLFDVIGRKPMIVATYGLAGVLMAVTSVAFGATDWLSSAWSLTAACTVVFFFASAAASAAYLTVGESFPLEMRALAIALFYAVGTAVGGVVGPALFGLLIEGGERGDIMWGYLIAAELMLIAAAAEWRLGFEAERKPLEEVAPSLLLSDIWTPGKIPPRRNEGHSFLLALFFGTVGALCADELEGVPQAAGALIGVAFAVLLSWRLEAGSGRR